MPGSSNAAWSCRPQAAPQLHCEPVKIRVELVDDAMAR